MAAAVPAIRVSNHSVKSRGVYSGPQSDLNLDSLQALGSDVGGRRSAGDDNRSGVSARSYRSNGSSKSKRSGLMSHFSRRKSSGGGGGSEISFSSKNSGKRGKNFGAM